MKKTNLTVNKNKEELTQKIIGSLGCKLLFEGLLMRLRT
jgi:hypothetical protein